MVEGTHKTFQYRHTHVWACLQYGLLLVALWGPETVFTTMQAQTCAIIQHHDKLDSHLFNGCSTYTQVPPRGPSWCVAACVRISGPSRPRNMMSTSRRKSWLPICIEGWLSSKAHDLETKMNPRAYWALLGPRGPCLEHMFSLLRQAHWELVCTSLLEIW